MTENEMEAGERIKLIEKVATQADILTLEVSNLK
jgi:hypothetical protein